MLAVMIGNAANDSDSLSPPSLIIFFAFQSAISSLIFFGHLTVEKILKAFFTDKKDKTPPFSHNLVYLAEKADLELNDDNLELLEKVSDFNLEARYPDDKFSFYKKSTVEFTKNKLEQIERLKKWLLQNLQSSI